MFRKRRTEVSVKTLNANDCKTVNLKSTKANIEDLGSEWVRSPSGDCYSSYIFKKLRRKK